MTDRFWQPIAHASRIVLAAHFLVWPGIPVVGERAAAQEAGVRVPVPRQTIYPGQRIQAAMIAWRAWRGRRNLAGLVTAKDALIGKVARSTLLPNRAIYIAALREPHAVDKGQMVGFFFKLNGIEIYGKGIAQQSGAVGAYVQVENVDSGRVISGTVQRDGSVRVGGRP